MPLTRWTLVTAVLFLLTSGVSAQEPKAADPLFQSHEILDVRIVAPLASIISGRSDELELPGTLHYTSDAGETVDLDIQMRARGRFRRKREICKFPPLRLNVVKSQAKGTLFHKQDKLKLVTHCQTSSVYEQVMLREYTAYRILNVMTEASFKVRLLRITYVDSDGERRDDVRYGFVIEHRDRLAKRLGKSVLEISGTHPGTLNTEYASIVALYHYLIGNTDFSTVKGTKKDLCCHNHILFGNEDEKIWSVPYDFDQAGLVDAPHAGSNPRFRLRSVRDRLYRGRCMYNDQLESTIARYNDKRDEVFVVLNEVKVAKKSTNKLMVNYVNKFYKTVNSAKGINSDLIKRCI
jgi:hypothetical protein